MAVEDAILEDVADWAAIRNAAIAELTRLALFASFEGEAQRAVIARRLELARSWTEGMPPRGSRTVVIRSVEIVPDPDAITIEEGANPAEHEVKVLVDGDRLITRCDDRPFTVVLTIERGHAT
jgi:hypothetical protein